MKWMKHLLDNMLQEKQHSHYMHQSGYWFIELKVSWSFILPPQSTKVQFECRFAFIMCELAIRAESLQSCVNRYTQCVCVCVYEWCIYISLIIKQIKYTLVNAMRLHLIRYPRDLKNQLTINHTDIWSVHKFIVLEQMNRLSNVIFKLL